MEVALIRIDVGNALDSIKDIISNADKRILAALGLVASSFALYKTLDAISTAGKTEIGWLRKVHEFVRIYWNSGAIMRYRHFFYNSRRYVVNYGSYGVSPIPVLRYKWKLQVRSCISFVYANDN